MQHHDVPYLKLVQDVISYGDLRPNRTGNDAISMFHGEMVFDLSDGSIPLLTTKKMFIPAIIHEMIWFLSGNTNIAALQENNVRIWNEWADDNGDLGPVYGEMWRAFPDLKGGTVDQISSLIDKIKNNPTDRRMIVSGWHPGLLPVDGVAPKDQVALGRQALPPCHMIWQCYVNQSNGTLDLKLYQRSADVFLGVPFNIAQYSILLHTLAHVTGYKPGRFIWTGGDIHIYTNLLEQCKEQQTRSPYPSPTLKINKPTDDIFSLTYEDFEIVGYQSHGIIKGKVAV